MAASRKKRRWSRVLHRWAGILLLIPILIATATGVLLNHTIDLGLSKRNTTNSWIQERYGMHLNGEPEAYGFEKKAYAAQWDGQIFFREKLIKTRSPLVGAVPLRDGIAIVTTNSVHYFGLDGVLIETLDSITLPDGEISRAGRSKDLALALETAEGIRISDRDLLEFSAKTDSEDIVWSQPVPVTDANRKLWERAYAGDGLPFDRVILDIHSGRFFGSIGKWIYDLMLFGVLVLSATGVVLFFKNRRRAS